MGIRYFAYSFDREMTEKALADPRSVIGGDPLADAEKDYATQTFQRARRYVRSLAEEGCELAHLIG